MQPKILYQDEHLLAIDKPAGLATIPEGWRQNAPHLRGWLESRVGPVWVVHRLDKITSGVVIFARDAETHRTLSKMFEKHRVEKVYHALLAGLPNWERITTRQPLRVNVGHKHRTIPDPKRGKPATTVFRVLQRFPSAVLVEAVPYTGRTHQIRAHARALGLPLLGDTRYNAPATRYIGRPALHAWQLTLPHPVNGARLILRANYPPDFQQALESLQTAAQEVSRSNIPQRG
jgi:RluA family pseudouridine synthase